jgi:tRNA pseudouridine13 synthase
VTAADDAVLAALAADVPLLTAALPGTGGALRAAPEDFVVDEVPAYAPSGAGDHVFVHVEKRGLTTPQLVAQLASALGVDRRDIGVAGMKDRHAVTRQWLSLPPPVTPERAAAVELADARVLAAVRHGHKLRTGHLRGNAFRLAVRGVAPGSAERARAILAQLARAPGAPNGYGEQRFGRAGDNAAAGLALVRGEGGGRGRDRRRDRLFVSALQSALFNQWLAARLADGLYATILAGDVLHKLARDARPGEAEPVRGGMFDCTDPAVDQARLAAGDLVPTGPMFGHRMRAPAAGTPAAERERAILAAAGLALEDFRRVGQLAEGTRRDAGILVGDPRVVELGPDAIEVAFTLPAGAYATTIMREVMKTTPEATPEATVGASGESSVDSRDEDSVE